MRENTILLVDDEENILNAAKRVLRNEGYTILTADCGETALSILAENHVQLVISDQKMPGMTGIALFSRIKDLYPDIVKVLLTGQNDFGVAIESINHGEVYRYLIKPLQSDEMAATISQCLAHYAIMQEVRELTQKTKEQNEELAHLNEQLADMVASQSQSLELSQEILERLPVAVIGISSDKGVALINNMAKKTIPELCQILPGSDISEFLPDEILQAVNTSMSDGKPNDSVRFMLDRNEIRGMIEPLQENGESRGCIIAFEIPEILHLSEIE